MINNRIQKICKLTNKKVVAEIGADHGYITKSLLDQNKIRFAYLTDISAKSLDKAVKNLDHPKYKNKTCFLVGDGLSVLENVKTNIPQQIIIAGMGGKEIIKILSKNNLGYTNFVLQPQKNVLELRKFLINNNYKIQKDEIVLDNKMYYFVLKVEKTNKKHNLTKNEILFGKTNLKTFSKDFVAYLKFEESKNQKILDTKFVKDINEKQKLIQALLKKGEYKNV